MPAPYPTSPWKLGKDLGGSPSYSRAPATYVIQGKIASNVEQHITIQGDSQTYTAVFYVQPGTNVFFAVNQTATVPTTTLSVGVGEGNVTQYTTIKNGDVLSMITPDTTSYVTVSLYSSDNVSL